MISHEEFMKMDLRVGKVIESERIPESKRLLKLIIDLGTEKRQIVTGLAEHYQPEEMRGKYVIVITNLEPRKIFGIESQGMILATCGEKGKPAVATIDKASDELVGERIC
ncbi:MAG: methionine--tRNA ligase subunit beta [Thermocladium sp.]|jgi:tRNA-binding protein